MLNELDATTGSANVTRSSAVNQEIPGYDAVLELQRREFSRSAAARVRTIASYCQVDPEEIAEVSTAGNTPASEEAGVIKDRRADDYRFATCVVNSSSRSVCRVVCHEAILHDRTIATEEQAAPTEENARCVGIVGYRHTVYYCLPGVIRPPPLTFPVIAPPVIVRVLLFMMPPLLLLLTVTLMKVAIALNPFMIAMCPLFAADGGVRYVELSETVVDSRSETAARVIARNRTVVHVKSAGPI